MFNDLNWRTPKYRGAFSEGRRAVAAAKADDRLGGRGRKLGPFVPLPGAVQRVYTRGVPHTDRHGRRMMAYSPRPVLHPGVASKLVQFLVIHCITGDRSLLNHQRSLKVSLPSR